MSTHYLHVRSFQLYRWINLNSFRRCNIIDIAKYFILFVPYKDVLNKLAWCCTLNRAFADNFKQSENSSLILEHFLFERSFSAKWNYIYDSFIISYMQKLLQAIRTQSDYGYACCRANYGKPERSNQHANGDENVKLQLLTPHLHEHRLVMRVPSH